MDSHTSSKCVHAHTHERTSAYHTPNSTTPCRPCVTGKQNEAEKEVGFLEHLDSMVGRKKVVEEERPQTVDVMELVGFDPNKEYTNKEITELAAKAVKVGKGLGLENGGAGRIEKDGESFGHDSKKKKK